jgi:fluoroquinolone resistance protein
MSNTYFSDQTYNQVTALEKGGIYEACTFMNCELGSADLTSVAFIDCIFKECNLSGANMMHATFNGVTFLESKLIGIFFDNCNDVPFKIKFISCNLQLTSFYKRSMKNFHFENCNLREVDFCDADVSNSLFDDCDFTAAKFEHTNLEKANLRSSRNFVLDPNINNVKKMKCTPQSALGLLHKFNLEIG